MAQWNSGATWSSGQLWGPAVTPVVPFNENTKNQPKKMKRQPYYPRLLADQAEWHGNLATKLPGYAAALSLASAEVDSAVADNLTLSYALGDWIVSVRDFAPSCTSSLDTLASGTGSANYAFPTHQVPTTPTLPSGITGVKPGALDRTFKLAQLIKARAGYTEAIGLDLGIVGSVAAEPPPSATPRIKVAVERGEDCDCAKVTFYKDGHQGVIVEGRRGGGAWEQLGIATKSPYLDERALLNATQAEIREYRARFWDDGKGNGDWCDVAKATISP